ncbi:MAG: type II toxin-antitoxin system RelE/ParE family toxin [Cloacibacillus sp.]
MWSVDYECIRAWLDEQDRDTVINIFAALKRLEQQGPTLGRPLVDTLKGTQVKNLKELRPASPGKTEVRLLFAFDPERKAVMLLGGDKSKGKSGRTKWSGWYKEAIPKAEAIYYQHLAQRGGNND